MTLLLNPESSKNVANAHRNWIWFEISLSLEHNLLPHPFLLDEQLSAARGARCRLPKRCRLTRRGAQPFITEV